MSVDRHIFVQTGLSTRATAARLARALHGELIEVHGEPAVKRHPAADPERWVLAQVVDNYLRDIEPVPGDEALQDGYDIAIEIWLSGRSDEDMLHVEARKIFDELVAAEAWPAIYVNIGGLVYSAFAPDLGRTDFPPRTSNAESGRPRWRAYASPRAPGS